MSSTGGSRYRVLDLIERDCLRRRAAVTLLIATLVAVSLLAVPVAGCSSETFEIQQCDLESAEILDSLTAGLAAVRKPLTLQLSETGAVKEALADYRKVIAKNQERLDTLHAPVQCRELVGKLRVVLDQGRDAADVSTQFADYLAQVTPIAAEASELVSTVSQLEPDARTAYGLVGFQDKASTILGQYQLVVPSPAFQELHRELGESLARMNENLEKASGVATRELPEESYEEEAGDEERSTPADKYLEEIVDDWESANRAMSNALQGAMESTGFNSKNAQFDNAVIGAQALIQELEKKYGVVSAGKK